MYEELIKSLRICGDWTEQVRLVGRDCCDGCKYQKDGVCESFNGNKELLLIEAADAIENTSKAYQMMAEAYEAEVTKQYWIPVTERLPGREWVLCKCRAKIHEVLSLRDGYWYHDPQHQYMSGFVTHWMPLPTPPEGESYGV